MRSAVRNTRITVAVTTVVVALTLWETGGRAASNRQSVAMPSQAFGTFPLTFVENRGQTHAPVRYYAQGPRYAIYVTQRDMVLTFLKDGRVPSGDGHVLALRFLDANPAVALAGERSEGIVSYIRGLDPSKWQTELPAYTEVTYRNLWPHVDMRVEGRSGLLKYEFHVAPGADPGAIRLAYDGASSLALADSGELLIGTSMGTLRDAAPTSYQIVAGARVPVESRYQLEAGGADHRVGFAVGAYRSDRELVIDPGIEYTTLLGGANDDQPGGIAVDAAGNVYITGFTQSSDFPTTAGAFDRTGALQTAGDAFVAKLNPTGTALVYWEFSGGKEDLEGGGRIAVDGSGNAYVVGQTKSGDFPTTANAFARSLAIPPNCPRCFADNYDSFVLKLNSTGSTLL